jgi:hypothetical protein
MPSSPTTSLRLEKQADGENTNIWGDKLDQALDKIDAAVAGWLTKALTGNYALATANYATDEASAAMLKFTGTGAFTVTVPAVSKAYRIWNACSGMLTITNGSSSTTVQPGEVVEVVTDGAANFARVQGTDFGGANLTGVTQITLLTLPSLASHVATKSYVDAAVSSAAFTTSTFGVPIASGDTGQFLTNNGATPSWAYPTTSQISDYAVDQATRKAAILGQAEAISIALASAL